MFSHLNGSEISAISRRVRPKAYARNVQLYGAGEHNPFLLIIHSGRVKIYRAAESGHEQLIRVLGPGDFIGETMFISQVETDHYAVTLEESEICSLHRDDFRDYLLRYPTITYRILETLSDRLMETEKMVMSLTGEDADRRIASYLVDLADDAGTTEIRLPISKKDLASYLGITPETLSRKLALFEDTGWIRQQPLRRIDILDYHALESL